MTSARPAVAVFCGSASGTRESYVVAARALGAAIAGRGWGLVYGGASVGLMGAVADAALAAGGHVHGVIPRSMTERELAHRGLSQLDVVETMHARKARMVELADRGAIALPGGFGTLDELFELVTWTHLGIVQRRAVLLDVDGYWDPLFAWADHAEREGFVRGSQRRSLERAASADEAVALLEHRFI